MSSAACVAKEEVCSFTAPDYHEKKHKHSLPAPPKGCLSRCIFDWTVGQPDARDSVHHAEIYILYIYIYVGPPEHADQATMGTPSPSSREELSPNLGRSRPACVFTVSASGCIPCERKVSHWSQELADLNCSVKDVHHMESE